VLKKILHYLLKVMILVVIPRYVGLSTADIAKNYLRVTVLLQYIPRIIRFVPLLGGNQSATGFIFESAWANFVINLLMFVMSGHVVGSCWYLFGLQVSSFSLQFARTFMTCIDKSKCSNLDNHNN
jgi:cyclic nucleotide gated channel